jgi:hypothetical protein
MYGDEIHQLKQEIIKLKRDLLEAITICEKKNFNSVNFYGKPNDENQINAKNNLFIGRSEISSQVPTEKDKVYQTQNYFNIQRPGQLKMYYIFFFIILKLILFLLL